MKRFVLALGCLALALSGCTLHAVSTKTRVGPEWRKKGAGAVRKYSTRWYAQQGVNLSWDNGVDTSVIYRRRDEDNGSADRDDALFFEFALPLWKSENHPDKVKDRRISELERRIQQLEAKLTEGERP